MRVLVTDRWAKLFGDRESPLSPLAFLLYYCGQEVGHVYVTLLNTLKNMSQIHGYVQVIFFICFLIRWLFVTWVQKWGTESAKDLYLWERHPLFPLYFPVSVCGWSFAQRKKKKREKSLQHDRLLEPINYTLYPLSFSSTENAWLKVIEFSWGVWGGKQTCG